MTEDVHKQNPDMDPAHMTIEDPLMQAAMEELHYPNTTEAINASVQYIGNTETSEQSLATVDPATLRYDQFRAYDIITAHLNATLAGESPPPLRMLIHGEPGTGKSKAIQTATEYFVARGVRFMLQKAAYTGIAASLIDGKTTHMIAMISPRKDHSVSVESKAKLQALWRHIQYLVIDEVSMISKAFLARLSRNISIGKMAEGELPSCHSFSGVSMILCSDFFQFLPVACVPSEALYFPTTTVQRNQEDSQTRCTIFEEFTTMVTLKEQMWVTDPVWQDFLQHLRVGQVQEKHIAMLCTLVLTNQNCMETDFCSQPWNNASLVTPRHGVRRIWNDTALHKHAKKMQSMVFECQAEDTINGQPLTLAEHYAALIRHQGADAKQ